MFPLCFVIVLAFCFRFATGNILIPGGDRKAPNIFDVILPNQRESLTDCYYRHFKYGKSSINKPAYGRPTYLREFAHMAAIGWTQPDGSITWNCGGSLIWENYILTAAHCAEDSQNAQPDVARFADLDLFNDTDDRYAQQLKIVEIIRHPEHKFRARYHDIALMRLEHSVSVHDTVVPACLWTDEEVRFKTFEATGWGDTGFGAEKTPILLKVSLAPVDNERCNQHYLNLRGLRAGLHANQLCAGDAQMDTCPGDSGGPLQVKLLHNTRITPFLVGVTSFGTACGLSVPGVYTRVAPYVPWIRTVLNDRGENATEWKFQPQACALRYAQYREYEPRVLLHKNELEESVDLSEAHLFNEVSRQQVSIHWNATNTKKECFGVIIDESTIATLAQCAVQKGAPPSYVRYLGDKTNIVTSSYKHPNWTEGSLYDDVGLLRLKDPIPFSKQFTPACIWERADLPESEYEVAGRGLLELNTIHVDDKDLEATATLNRTIDVLGVVKFHNTTNCTHISRFSEAEHLCFGAEPFLVPGTCQQSPGGPIHREIMRSYRSLMYVFALNLYGRDCGFGEAAIGVRLSTHMPWMESVLLAKADEDEDRPEPFIFLNNDLEEGDPCTVNSTVSGVCTNAIDCPFMLHRYRQNQPVRFCQSGSVMCCPREYVRNETDAEWREIDGCANAPIEAEEDFDQNRHVVIISWTVGQEEQGCIGTMITTRTYVTAASCLEGATEPVYVHVEPRDLKMEVLIVVNDIIVHPEYDSVTKRHNIALASTTVRAEKYMGKVPVCLWSNATHTPFYLQQVGLSEHQDPNIKPAFTKFNTDCERSFGRVLVSEELCLDVEYPEEEIFVIDEGTPAFWTHQKSIHYLVGIASHNATNDSSVLLHTRIAPYVSWIKSVL